jgi:hypothetical protein
MTNKDKMKLAVAAVILLLAGGLIYWNLRGESPPVVPTAKGPAADTAAAPGAQTRPAAGQTAPTVDQGRKGGKQAVVK